MAEVASTFKDNGILSPADFVGVPFADMAFSSVADVVVKSVVEAVLLQTEKCQWLLCVPE